MDEKDGGGEYDDGDVDDADDDDNHFKNSPTKNVKIQFAVICEIFHQSAIVAISISPTFDFLLFQFLRTNR